MEGETAMVSDELYQVRRIAAGYRVVKFDSWINILSISHVTGSDPIRRKCDCPANSNPFCRHRRLVFIFEGANKVDTGWFYDFVEEKWIVPIGKLVLKKQPANQSDR
jgi:hypothetical protein